MTKPIAIHWFKQDLRLSDNPALHAAIKTGRVLPIYIWDTNTPDMIIPGGASRWWLTHSLESLNRDLNNQLNCYMGDPLSILKTLIQQFQIKAVFWNRCYEPWQIQRDKNIKTVLQKSGIDVHTYNANLLWEPWTVLKSDGSPYKVFTPFYKNGCQIAQLPRTPLPAPSHAHYHKDKNAQHLTLLPPNNWSKKFERYWKIGETNAQHQLENFISTQLAGYNNGRDFPAKSQTSRLSPHLHFGELSPNQIWYSINSLAPSDDTACFLSELAWREFSYYLLYHFPTLPTDNFQKKFDLFPWKKNMKLLTAWQQGQTGIPIIDAGMRELWETGYMHNRVRMIAASFLVKNCLIDWRDGAKWFWDCLVDADLANNSASWQWVAGSGADAAPYFRIFNPILQAQKFDPNGEYILKYVPELKHLEKKHLFSPWESSHKLNYPDLVIDLKKSREAALTSYQSIR